MKYPKILEGTHDFYKLNQARRRCLLEQIDNGEDYSTSYKYVLNVRGLRNSPCSDISCSDCIFGCPRTKEKLEEAERYWGNSFSYELESADTKIQETIIDEIDLLL